ncbi:uncharacterized protein V2V93DRAFT_374048 [Kockiozyma suomiensis]|uniref:uncharacterized protein n=1 Tax=Kockiozyma suomiensis TaxID=1337062 RepID=UPI00334353B3
MISRMRSSVCRLDGKLFISCRASFVRPQELQYKSAREFTVSSAHNSARSKLEQLKKPKESSLLRTASLAIKIPRYARILEVCTSPTHPALFSDQLPNADVKYRNPNIESASIYRLNISLEDDGQLKDLPSLDGATLVHGRGAHGNALYDIICLNGTAHLFPDFPSIATQLRKTLKPGTGILVMHFTYDPALDSLPYSYYSDGRRLRSTVGLPKEPLPPASVKNRWLLDFFRDFDMHRQMLIEAHSQYSENLEEYEAAKKLFDGVSNVRSLPPALVVAQKELEHQKASLVSRKGKIFLMLRKVSRIYNIHGRAASLRKQLRLILNRNHRVIENHFRQARIERATGRDFADSARIAQTLREKWQYEIGQVLKKRRKPVPLIINDSWRKPFFLEGGMLWDMVQQFKLPIEEQSGRYFEQVSVDAIPHRWKKRVYVEGGTEAVTEKEIEEVLDRYSVRDKADDNGAVPVEVGWYLAWVSAQ